MWRGSVPWLVASQGQQASSERMISGCRAVQESEQEPDSPKSHIGLRRPLLEMG